MLVYRSSRVFGEKVTREEILVGRSMCVGAACHVSKIGISHLPPREEG